MRERLHKFIIMVVSVPVLLSMLLFIAVLVLFLPLLALIYPEKFDFRIQKEKE